MKEFELTLLAVSEIFKSLAKGAVVLSKKINDLSKSMEEQPVRIPAVKSISKPANSTPPDIVGKITAADKILYLIQQASDGADTEYLMERSDFDRKKVQNIIFKLKKLKKIKIKSRGVYVVS